MKTQIKNILPILMIIFIMTSYNQTAFGSDGENGEIEGYYIGTPGIDYIKGSKRNDLIIGYECNDCIQGREGNDIIYGCTGNDYIEGHSGNDTIYGGDGDDEIYGGSGENRIFPDAGTNVIYPGWQRCLVVLSTSAKKNTIYLNAGGINNGFINGNVIIFNIPPNLNNCSEVIIKGENYAFRLFAASPVGTDCNIIYAGKRNWEIRCNGHLVYKIKSEANFSLYDWEITPAELIEIWEDMIEPKRNFEPFKYK